MAGTVDAMLQPMDRGDILEFHASLITHIQGDDASIEVVPDVDGKGKGIVACKAMQHGERIFTEAPLVGSTST